MSEPLRSPEAFKAALHAAKNTIWNAVAWHHFWIRSSYAVSIRITSTRAF